MVSFLAGVHVWLRNILIRTVLGVLRLFSPSLDALVRRSRQSPGLPLPGSTQPYWTLPPSPIASHNSGSDVKLPSYADVVVIGSGITGTAFARTLLDCDTQRKGNGTPLQVVMLEARDTCSGATGRNGGHITPILYAEYSQLKEKYGVEMAQKIIRFRLGHLKRALSVAAEENLLDQSQCREVEAFDVFHDLGLFEAAKAKLETYMADFPAESAEYRIYGPEDIAALQLSESTVGCMSTRAGAIHPYRLVTGILTRLLKLYEEQFRLFTHTPCTAISAPDENQLYHLVTPKGTIATPHVIHATNGWVAHLLPGLRSKIIPARGTMTAQRPWAGLGQDRRDGKKDSWAGHRSFVFFPTAEPYNYDYLTQQLPAARSGSLSQFTPSGELMLGGGFLRNNAVLTELGNSDDRTLNEATGDYLAGALGDYFVGGDDKEEEKERVKATWSGVLGISCDGNPWVGRVPSQVSGRCNIRTRTTRTTRTSLRIDAKEVLTPISDFASGLPSQSTGSDRLALPGEWVAAGYTGEGMVHAWRSGEALAMMILELDGSEPSAETMKTDADTQGIGEWFPDVFRVTEDRLKSTGVEDLIAAFI